MDQIDLLWQHRNKLFFILGNVLKCIKKLNLKLKSLTSTITEAPLPLITSFEFPWKSVQTFMLHSCSSRQLRLAMKLHYFFTHLISLVIPVTELNLNQDAPVTMLYFRPGVSQLYLVFTTHESDNTWDSSQRVKCFLIGQHNRFHVLFEFFRCLLNA